jgi:predicted alpha/beta superfamily hydrolase
MKQVGIGVASGFLVASCLVLPAPYPVGSGFTGSDSIVRHEAFASQYIEARTIEVWLPPGYAAQSTQRFPVIFMQDGQNLFDASPTRSIAGVNWGIDKVMARLITEGRIPAAIVVGIASTAKRYEEYMPRKAVSGGRLSVGVPGRRDFVKEELVSDRYLRFLVEELKPFIDSTYRTLPDRANTLVMGSSMGGLISAYAISEYPEVFGGAACVSTHWPAADGAVIDYLAAHLPDPARHRFYFDYGTETLDAGYEPYQRRMDEVMRKAGYTEGVNWVTRKYPGAEHSERAWRLRADVPLRFLLTR